MEKRIGIIGAMQEEVDLLIGRMAAHDEQTVSGMTFYEGTLAGVPVVVARSGVGKVAAAMCAQTLIVRFGATQVINTGVAGALDPRLDIGDLVVSTDAVQYDMDVSGLGYEPGFISVADRVALPASDELRALVVEAAAEAMPAITIVEGRVGTGDLFVCSHEARERIIDRFDARCCEMEGGAIAQVCFCNGVPFVIVRTISDRADDTGTTDYRTFVEEVAHRCAVIVERAVAALA